MKHVSKESNCLSLMTMKISTANLEIQVNIKVHGDRE